jgi:hypothetical protein
MNSLKAKSVVTEGVNLWHSSLMPSVASPARAPLVYYGNAHRLKARDAADALNVHDDVADDLAVSHGRSTADTFL